MQLSDRIAGLAATALPVNALVIGGYTEVTHAQFAGIAVARLSLGPALARAAQRLIADAGHALFDHGEFSPLSRTISGGAGDDSMSKA